MIIHLAIALLATFSCNATSKTPTPPRHGTAVGTPGTIATICATHHNPTPDGTRAISITARKALRIERIIFNEESRIALQAMIDDANTLEQQPKGLNSTLYGYLHVNNRVVKVVPYNLRHFISNRRASNPTAFGSNRAPMPKKDGKINTDNIWTHSLPLEMILEIIKMGKTFTYNDPDTGKPLLVIKADAFGISNDARIDACLGAQDHIQLTFGYPIGSSEISDPFHLFHAQVQHTGSVGIPAMTPVAGVRAYIDNTVSGDGSVLRFKLP
jgi:hypothetical protein